MNALAGLFITLEGGEGAGKSTLARALCARLEDDGQGVVTTREPGGTELAEALRALALAPRPDGALSGLTTALIMNAARRDHLERVIRPALQDGLCVICDRFADSTRAYQLAMGGISKAAVNQLEDLVVEGTRPDVTLILDAEPADLLGRRRSRAGDSDVFEARELAFHREIRAQFLAIARREPGRCHVLDALSPPETLLEQASAIIATALKARGEE